MRLDASRGPTAADLVAELDEDELLAILREGDEPHARRIARAVVEARRRHPVTTTRQLADIVEAAKPREHGRGSRRSRGERGRGGRSPIHPATLSFQALRIAVNRELEGLDGFVADAVNALAPGGRIAIISFHAGEDRAIKNALADLAGRCTCPAQALRCECGRIARVRILTRKPIRPSVTEIESNPRSRSARLRVAERLAASAA